MARVLVTHPSSVVREAHRTLLQACGWSVTEASSRREALTRLAGPSSRRFGDLVLVDLSNWTVPGTALVRHLRHQLACTLPVLVLLPLPSPSVGAPPRPTDTSPAPETRPGDLALEAASRAGANMVLTGNAGPRTLASAVSLLTGRPLPGLARLVNEQGGEMLDVADAWHQQQGLLGQEDLAAATVVSARQVFELLLSQRLDANAADAALALAQLAGGPVPLRRWSLTHDPEGPLQHHQASRLVAPRSAYTAMLVMDAGGQAYGLPLDGAVGPTRWWTDGGTAPHRSMDALQAVPLVRLLGPTGFRRLLATDRATVVLSHCADPAGTEVAVRVDELQGLQQVAVQAHTPTMHLASGCLGTGRCNDGQPLLVLDAAALWRHVATLTPRFAP